MQSTATLKLTAFLRRLLPLVAAVATAPGLSAQTPPDFLWQIGKPDQNNAEFALAPRGYSQFKEDGVFIVGASDAKRDWPYVQPGPHDAWAGSRVHTFTVLFGLRSLPAAGECRLQFALLDTQAGGPPKLKVEINGHAHQHATPAGGGDESVNGQPKKGKPHAFAIAFPSAQLRAGENEIRITTTEGSWLLYDWLGLATPTGTALAPVSARTFWSEVKPIRALLSQGGSDFQPVRVTLRQYGSAGEVTVRAGDAASVTTNLPPGAQTVELLVPAVSAETKRTVSLSAGGKELASREVTLKPVKKLTVYVLPHSHTDIGYTEIQTDIEKKQVQNLIDGMAAAKRTAEYPEGARFVWNVEVGWAADLYLRRLSEAQKAEFLAAVKSGQVALCGMYLNELTGLCRPEELLRLFRFGTRLAEQTGRPVDSVMISDVPGYTWGTVTAMNHAGINYFSTAPNYFDRIGTILREWENKPFWWVGPDGQSKVLVWIPFWGYAMSHRYGKFSPELVEDFSAGLEQRGYPYDIAHVRWSGHGDNAVPDPVICEFIRDWNAKYTWPKFKITGVSEAFRALEDRYGKDLPVVRGDWTPYWEDGAGSSALETALNRETSDRLAQAETLFALRNPKAYPAAAFEDAWISTLLYSEHTWGAWCSVSDPERKETLEQWEIKKSYAEQADKQSRELLLEATAPVNSGFVAGGLSQWDVINTVSWPRSGLVVRRTMPPQGERVVNEAGQPMPSQRMGDGSLVFLALDVPPLAARRFSLENGPAGQSQDSKATASGNVLENGLVRVRVDEKTGGIVELTARGLEGNFADTSGGEALNDYLYLPGDDLKNLQRNGPVTIRVGEKGPLVASLIIESEAPGCRKLTRELRLVAGQDYVECINTVDKARLAAKSYKRPEGKESVNFAFPFAVPGGEVWLDLPLGLMRPEADQMPSACKNWFTVGRYADVSTADRGVTLVTLDAPLLQVGGLTARLLESQTNPDVWLKEVKPTQRLYSWAMNNHWGTNYRAYQEGPTVFRFILRPHGRRDPVGATRFATGVSQPLLALPARAAKATSEPLLTVQPPDVIVQSLKPSDDGKALIVRLFNPSATAQTASVKWSQPPRQVSLSDTSEQPRATVNSPLALPSQGLVTLRAELP
jgi:alpha-mannosidase